MNDSTHQFSNGGRCIALVVTAAMTAPTLLAGCGNQQAAAPPPPVDDTRGGAMAPRPGAVVQRKPGLSKGQKVALLVGAAAVYYMYRRHQKKLQAQGQQPVQYYRSKNGRVYYRDPQTHGAHWVTPSVQPIQVPEQEASEYQDIQGYNSSPTGRGISDLFQAQNDSSQ